MGKLGYLPNKIFSLEVVVGPVVEISCVFEQVPARMKFVNYMKQLSAFCQGPIMEVLVAIKKTFGKAINHFVLRGSGEGTNVVHVANQLV